MNRTIKFAGIRLTHPEYDQIRREITASSLSDSEWIRSRIITGQVDPNTKAPSQTQPEAKTAKIETQIMANPHSATSINIGSLGSFYGR
jgi:hypothetical protein